MMIRIFKKIRITSSPSLELESEMRNRECMAMHPQGLEKRFLLFCFMFSN